MGQNPGTPGEPQNSWDLWMFIPLKMVLIGIDPYPYSYGIDGPFIVDLTDLPIYPLSMLVYPMGFHGRSLFSHGKG